MSLIDNFLLLNRNHFIISLQDRKKYFTCNIADVILASKFK